MLKNLLNKIRKTPVIGRLAESELSLIEVHKNCQEIVDRINKRFEQMPRSYTCVDSRVPEGRIFCEHFKRCCISYCNYCENFRNKYLIKK